MSTPTNQTAGPDEELNAILAVPRAKKHLPKWAVVLLILLPLLLAGGITLGVHMHQQQQHQEMVAFVKENETIVFEYFHKAKSVTLNYDTVQLNPMGGVDFSGYLDDDPKLKFYTNLDYFRGTVKLGAVSLEPGMEKYIDTEN